MSPSFGSSPLIAASAAARLVRSILARLSTPHALPTARPLSGAVLWRQVARRLGYGVDRPRPISSDQGDRSSIARGDPRPSVPPVSFVWHTRAVAPRNVDDSAAKSWPAATVPAGHSRQSFQIVGQPTPVPDTPPTQAPIQRQSASTSPAPALPSPSESGPPVFIPATRVQVEYVAGPIGRNTESLILSSELIRESTVTVQYPSALAFEKNRDLVPTTDLLSRMVRTPQIEFKPARPRTSTTPVEIAVAQEPQALNMPLVAPAARSIEVPQSGESSPPPVLSNRGALGRLVDRVISALPIPKPLRRVVHLEQTYTPSTPMSPSLTSLPGHLAIEPDATNTQSQDIQSAPQQPALPVQEPPIKDLAVPLTPLPISEATPDVSSHESSSQLTRGQVAASEVRPEAPSAQPVQREISRGQESLLGNLVGRLLGSSNRGAGPADVPPLRMPWARPVPQRPAPTGDAGPEDEIDSLRRSFTPAAQPPQIAMHSLQAGQDIHPLPPAASTAPLSLEVADATGAQAESATEPPPLNIAPSALLPPPDAGNAAPVHTAEEAISSDDLAWIGVTGEAPAAQPWQEMPGVASELAGEHAALVKVARPLAYQSSLVHRILSRFGGSRLGGGTGEGALSATETPLFTSFEGGAQSASFASPLRIAPAMSGNIRPDSAAVHERIAGQWISSEPGSTPATAVASALYADHLVPETIGSRSRPASSILARIPSFASALLSKNRLVPSPADLASSIYGGDSGAGDMNDMNDYMEALQQLYGPDNSASGMPLAVPFGAYASPAERNSYFAEDRSGDSIDPRLEPGGSDGYSLQHAPAIDYFASEPVSASGHAGGLPAQITDYSWGDASDDSAYAPEADGWADVVAAAVGSGHSAGSPALALAGAETSPDAAPQRPPNEDHVAGPGLDELADTVYSLIRERLAIEKERSFT